MEYLNVINYELESFESYYHHFEVNMSVYEFPVSLSISSTGIISN